MTTVGEFAWVDVQTRSDQEGAIGVRAGVDRVELSEFERAVGVAGDEFLRRIFNEPELVFCAGRIERLATRFAAKEATVKMLGTGLRGMSWHDIEVRTASMGQPTLALRGRGARDRGDALRIRSMSVSLTHTSVTAEAFVVALIDNPVANDTTGEENRCD